MLLNEKKFESSVQLMRNKRLSPLCAEQLPECLKILSSSTMQLLQLQKLRFAYLRD